MGSTEEVEPPLKRVRTCLPEFYINNKNNTDYSYHIKGVANSLGASMASSLFSQGDGEIVGSTGVIHREEFVKIISRALYSLGYDKTGALLEEESGIPLHLSAVASLMRLVLDGRWDDSLTTLRAIGVPYEIEKSASFLILEQKFIEHLKNGNTKAALLTLRNDISPLGINVKRVHELAACIISHSHSQCTSPNNEAICASPRSLIMEKLQKLLPASMIIPERRLEQLVEQALDVQQHNCLFHNTFDSELSLYTDHQCGRSQIPSQTLQILQAHNDEVWYLQFSHNGKYLASASKDQLGIIWEVQGNGELFMKHMLIGHQKPVLIVLWSPDDSQLLTCGVEEVVRRWDAESGECLQVYEKPGVGLISCGWLPDGKGVFTGVADKSISLWDLDGREVECWKGPRTLKMADMAMTNDGKRIISICRKNAILLLDRDAKLERWIEEDQVITSFALSNDSNFLLVNLVNQEIHLWSLQDINNEEDNLKVVSKYKGHKRSRFIIRSCFGGIQQGFVASGSEDSQVYIWHRSSGELIVALPGHSGAVNCVSWNPTNPHMLASASDDRTIRIWGLTPKLNFKSEAAHTNGFMHHHHHSNGKT